MYRVLPPNTALLHSRHVVEKIHFFARLMHHSGNCTRMMDDLSPCCASWYFSMLGWLTVNSWKNIGGYVYVNDVKYVMYIPPSLSLAILHVHKRVSSQRNWEKKRKRIKSTMTTKGPSTRRAKERHMNERVENALKFNKSRGRHTVKDGKGTLEKGL